MAHPSARPRAPGRVTHRVTHRAARRARASRVLGPVAALLLGLAACVPATGGTTPPASNGPAAPALPADDVRTVRAPRDLGADDPLLRTAWEAWLRMELRRVQTGAYATEALLDLALPAGVRWTVVEYGPDDYELAMTADAVPTTLRVDPDGVHVRP